MTDIDTAPLFLDDEELAELTGRKIRSLQVEQLRAMLVPFRINARGRPIVTRAAVIGTREAPEAKQWAPRLAAR